MLVFISDFGQLQHQSTDFTSFHQDSMSVKYIVQTTLYPAFISRAQPLNDILYLEGDMPNYHIFRTKYTLL